MQSRKSDVAGWLGLVLPLFSYVPLKWDDAKEKVVHSKVRMVGILVVDVLTRFLGAVDHSYSRW